ncbi:hypothetical protein ACI2LM_15915 [Paenibacillus lautus]|uniref:hypothetical protein n=1 Tax=Paenibacillus lautus TaxID=1401 RepID=UPI0038511BD7
MDYGRIAMAMIGGINFPKKSISAISRGKYYSTPSDGTNNDLTYQSKHEVLGDCFGLQLLYGNFYQDDRTTDLSPFELNVSVFVNGVNYPMFFDNGNVKKRFALGTMGLTDVLPLSLKRGDMIYVRTHVVQNAGEKHPRGLLLFSSPNNEGYTLGDTTETPTAVTPVPGTLYGLTPLALYATPSPSAGKFRTVGICGSSSSTGTGRSNTVLEGHPQGDIGFIQIGAMRAGWGYVTTGMNGQKASDFAEPVKRRSRLQMMKDCDLVIVQYSSNDLSDNTMTFEKLRDNLLKIHQGFWDMGIPTAQVTVNPRTNSTDNWTTLENQSPINANFAAGPESVRGRYNAWVMNNTDGIKGIDANIGWESSPNSGKWGVVPQKTTDDGIHPNTYGHDNAAANAVRDYLLNF